MLICKLVGEINLLNERAENMFAVCVKASGCCRWVCRSVVSSFRHSCRLDEVENDWKWSHWLDERQLKGFARQHLSKAKNDNSNVGIGFAVVVIEAVEVAVLVVEGATESLLFGSSWVLLGKSNAEQERLFAIQSSKLVVHNEKWLNVAQADTLNCLSGSLRVTNLERI